MFGGFDLSLSTDRLQLLLVDPGQQGSHPRSRSRWQEVKHLAAAQEGEGSLVVTKGWRRNGLAFLFCLNGRRRREVVHTQERYGGRFGGVQGSGDDIGGAGEEDCFY